MTARRRQLTAATALLLSLGCLGGPVADRPLSVVVVCIDTLRADRLGCYGNRRDTSPTIDRLAAAGVRFEHAFAHSSWTVPATASLLSSRLPAEHGAGLAGELKSLNDQPLQQMRKEVKSLASYLEDAGFATAMYSANPFLRGRFTRGFATAEVRRVDATSLTDRAIGWLNDRAEHPFFLYLHYMDLHQPVEPPAEYFHYFGADLPGSRGEPHRNWRFRSGRLIGSPEHREYRGHRLAAYDGALRFVDHEVGRLLAALDEGGLSGSTLVVVTSDHGEEFWEHAELGAALGGDPRGIYGVGHGHSMFNELLRVPLIIAGPTVPAAIRVTERVGHIDLAPTIMELLGREPPDEMEGLPLQSLWTGGSGSWRPRPLIADSPAYGPAAASVVAGDNKLIVRADGVTMLFDLAADPAETVNLAAERRELVAGLGRVLQAATDSSQLSLEERDLTVDDETRRQLRELGYLQ